jgi:hypothetical protein
VIHAQVDEKGKFDNVEVVSTLVANDFLWMKHVNWWWTNPTPTT